MGGGADDEFKLNSFFMEYGISIWNFRKVTLENMAVQCSVVHIKLFFIDFINFLRSTF